jgi:hypothetical protein
MESGWLHFVENEVAVFQTKFEVDPSKVPSVPKTVLISALAKGVNSNVLN